MDQLEVDRLWFESESIPGVKFKLNDSATITAGLHKGKSVSIIALISLKPMPTYLVELGEEPYGDLRIPEANLAPQQ